MIWDEWERRLAAVSDDARRELSYFAAEALGIDAGRVLLLRLTGALPVPQADQAARMAQWIQRRCAGEPIQYLLGKADFYGRSFAVAPGVLIPRFDTEILVREALSVLRDGDRVLDLCAGSGCIGLSVGAETDAEVTCVEKYEDAFALLCRNRDRIYPRAKLIKADVLTDPVDGRYDMILSNPPYIPTAQIAGLSSEVRREPVTALDGGEDGLDFYGVLARRCLQWIVPGGTLLLECGIGQAESVERILRSAGWLALRRVSDYGGIARVVCGVAPREE